MLFIFLPPPLTRSVSGSPMSLRRKLILGVAVTLASVGVYYACRVLYTLRHIPEAYAAWDTGQLLVKYMQMHEDRWPSSWDDLLSVVSTESGPQVILRGARAGDTNDAFSLRTLVSVNWKFDPARSNLSSAVTRPDGTKFPVVWVEPNEMIRAHLKRESEVNRAR